MQLKMKFLEFVLLKIDFSLNEKYKPKKKEDVFSPKIVINADFSNKEKTLGILLGLRQNSGNIPYYFEVRGAGLFKFNKMPEKQLLEQFKTINCPAIIFPYIRETIADITRRAGFAPLHLDPINFIELAKQKGIPEKPKTTKKKSAKKKIS